MPFTFSVFSYLLVFTQINHLEDYMTFMKLPKALRMRINNYYQARYAGKWYDEKDVLKWVSSSLREVLLTVGNVR